MAAAQDWKIKNTPGQGTIDVDLYSIGGTFDMTIMINRDPNDVIRQYYSIIGSPVITPQWALGWH